ncbi:uncharacterized protein TNCV_4442241 [Trichonephila clavipes]|nr:uncharacterized protein TNCV_4442241 [Trichonephila clavipes]
MIHTSNERATETVLFAGMCAHAHETYANFPPFLSDHCASRKIATSKQKAFCVLLFAKTESAITVQRAFHIKFGCQPSNDNNILRWFHQFETTGCLCKGKKSEPNNFIWQQNGAPPHWHLSVHDWSNITLPNQWIDRKEPPDKACIAWPLRSPDLTPSNFYLRELIKDCVYVPPLPADLSE